MGPITPHPGAGKAHPGAGKAHPAHPQTKPDEPPHPKSGMGEAHEPHSKAKDAAKKKAHTESTKGKHDEKKRELREAEEKRIHEEEIKRKKAREHTEKKSAKEATKKRRDRARPFSDGEVISLLHTSHQQLHMPDHDYDGHRRRASEHVGAALRHFGGSPQSAFHAGKGRANSPQQVSDSMLARARTSLQEIRGHLASGTEAKHRDALHAVDAAISEIDQALTIR